MGFVGGLTWPGSVPDCRAVDQSEPASCTAVNVLKLAQSRRDAGTRAPHFELSSETCHTVQVDFRFSLAAAGNGPENLQMDVFPGFASCRLGQAVPIQRFSLHAAGFEGFHVHIMICASNLVVQCISAKPCNISRTESRRCLIAVMAAASHRRESLRH